MNDGTDSAQRMVPALISKINVVRLQQNLLLLSFFCRRLFGKPTQDLLLLILR